MWNKRTFILLSHRHISALFRFIFLGEENIINLLNIRHERGKYFSLPLTCESARCTEKGRGVNPEW